MTRSWAPNLAMLELYSMTKPRPSRAATVDASVVTATFISMFKPKPAANESGRRSIV